MTSRYQNKWSWILQRRTWESWYWE